MSCAATTSCSRWSQRRWWGGKCECIGETTMRGLWAASLATTQKQDGTRCAWLMGSVIGCNPETGRHTKCAWFMGSVIGCDAETGRHKVRVVYGQRHWLRRRNRMAHKVRVVYGQRHWMQPRNRTAHKVRVVSGQRHWLQPRNRTAQGARG